jgi:hypothetical protein
MFRLLKVIISFTMLLLLYLYSVKLCFMLVSGSGTDQKKKNGSLNLLSCVIILVFMLRTYASLKILFSYGMHGSSLQVLYYSNK